MDRFICDENIARYRKLLADPNVGNDKVRHAELLRQLAAEIAKGRDIALLTEGRPLIA